MCKYLMKSMAAVCFCGFLAGCSHDFGIDDGTSVKQTVEETYKKAFVTHFGEPASDRTWGFGPGASATRAKTRALESEYAGSYAKAAADYLEGLTVAEMSQYTAFTNSDLDQQSTLTNPVSYGSTSTTATYSSGSYKVPANYDPSTGTSVNVMDGDTKVGTLTFGEPVSVGDSENAKFWYGVLTQTSGNIFSASGDINSNSYKYGGAYELADNKTFTLNPTSSCTVTIEQSTANDNTLKFDNTVLAISSATNKDNRRVYTINNVSAGSHTITKGSIKENEGESGLWEVTVTYAGSTVAVTDNNGNSGEGYTSRVARTYYRFTPEIDGKITFYHKQGASNNAISIKDNNSYYQYNSQDYRNQSWYNSGIGDFDVVAGHTYELTLNTAEDGCYGVKMSYSTTTTTTTEDAYVGGGDGRHYRVASGTTITKPFHANGNDENQQPMMNGVVVYVEGTLNLYGYNDNKNTLNSTTIVVANGGQVILNGEVDMSNYGRFVVLGGGSITGVNGSALKVNNGAKSYNAGTINYSGELNVNGSDFYNCGTINLSSMRNTSGGKITNFGHITCGTNLNAADAYNCEMINGCYWHYTGDAGIGKLTMLKNSRLDVDGKAEFTQSWQSLDVQTSTPDDLQSATIASPNILMDKSVVNVGTAFVTNTVFQGPTAEDEFAIVKMGKVQVGNGTDLMQRENCYFDWDITELYNKQDRKYQDIPAADKVYNPYGYLVDYYRVHITKFASESDRRFYIPAAETADDCTGAGYAVDATEENNENNENNDNADEIVVLAEDLTIDDVKPDFDFNDAVFKVTRYTDGEKKGQVWVTVLAAGGTLPLYIDGNEIHAKFAEVNPDKVITTGTMMNTYNGRHDQYKTPSFQVTASGTTIEEIAASIDVEVVKYGTPIKLEAPKGGVPTKIAVGVDFLETGWCDERQDIDDKYLRNDGTALFRNYVRGQLGDNWYQLMELRTSNNQ